MWSLTDAGVPRRSSAITSEIDFGTQAFSSVTALPLGDPQCQPMASATLAAATPGRKLSASGAAPTPTPTSGPVAAGTARRLLRGKAGAVTASSTADVALAPRDTTLATAAAAGNGRRLAQPPPQDLQTKLNALMSAFW